MTKIMIIGTFVMLCGVVWVALAKGSSSDISIVIYEDDRNEYRLISIGLSLFSGLLGAIRIQQAKYVNMRLNYGPLEFSTDASLLCGTIIFLISLFYFTVGHPSYTWYNFGISFIAGSFQTLTGLIGLNACVKGLGGPTSAILQTQAVFGTILNAVFLAMIPTLFQLGGSFLALAGVLIILVFK